MTSLNNQGWAIRTSVPQPMWGWERRTSGQTAYLLKITLVFSYFRFIVKLVRVQKAPISTPPPHSHWWAYFPLMNNMDTSLSTKDHGLHGFTGGGVHSMGLDKCVMACIYHCRIIQSSWLHLLLPSTTPWQLLIFFSGSTSMWDLSSLTRDQTCAPCVGSSES